MLMTGGVARRICPLFSASWLVAMTTANDGQLESQRNVHSLGPACVRNVSNLLLSQECSKGAVWSEGQKTQSPPPLGAHNKAAGDAEISSAVRLRCHPTSSARAYSQ
jgi:hypothetical protein